VIVSGSLAFAVLLAALTPAPRPATTADCEAGEHRGDAQPYRCFHMLVRRDPGMRSAVDRLLRSRLDRDPGDRTALLAVALLARDRGDPQAEVLLRRSADAQRRAGDARGEADAWRSLTPLLGSQGRLAEADEAQAAAARAAHASGDRDRQAAAKLLAAGLAHRRFQHDRAWALQKEVEPAVFPSGPPWLQSMFLAAQGGTHWGLGRHGEARDCYRRQLEIVRAEGDRYHEAEALFSVALTTSRAGASFTPEANRLTQEALAAALASGNPWAEVSARMGMAQEPDRPLEQKIEQVERALAVLRRTRDLGNTCFALRELARWLQDRPGGLDDAFRAADEAVRIAREAGDRFHVARGMLRRWNLALVWRPREEALAAGFEALDAVEAVRGIQRDEDARARVLGEWVFVYQQVLGYLLEPKGAAGPSASDIARAFQVAERLRAQELVAALDAAGSTPLLGHGRPEHAARQAVLDEIARTQQRLLDVSLAAPDRRRLLAELDGLEGRERTLRDRLAHADPSFAAARSPRLAAVEELRGALAADQALISYVLRQRASGFDIERPRAFVLTREAVRVVTLPDGAANPLRSVTGLSGLVARRDGSEGDGAARLYQLLLHDALSVLPPSVTRLVIVPDAALHRLPFDALRAQPGASPLAERYEVTVAPSASLWLRLRARPGVPGAALLALADPHWPGPPAAPAARRQAAPWEGLALGSLPRGRREARLALRSLSGDGRVLIGEQASERFLKTARLRSYALLHLAAHAVVDDDNPERSAIVLAPGAREEDGLLQSREIVGLDLSGLVIVLSACRSSSGQVVAGEGPLSLARAFLQAGARAVVGNLWEVRDDDAEALMATFYRELAQGRSVASALAAARRERRRAGAPAAAWAGTVVLGDGDATLGPATAGRHGRVAAWLAAALAAAVLGPLALWWRRRSRGSQA
jgi:CHAT domain-containing protein/tetratricopeptide (TPR) repeat protein